MLDTQTKGRTIRTYPADLTPEIQAALGALADVEAEYDSAREKIEQTCPEADIESLLDDLEQRRQVARGPLVQRLAELQQEMTLVMMARELGKQVTGGTQPALRVGVSHLANG